MQLHPKTSSRLSMAWTFPLKGPAVPCPRQSWVRKFCRPPLSPTWHMVHQRLPARTALLPAPFNGSTLQQLSRLEIMGTQPSPCSHLQPAVNVSDLTMPGMQTGMHHAHRAEWLGVAPSPWCNTPTAVVREGLETTAKNQQAANTQWLAGNRRWKECH